MRKLIFSLLLFLPYSTSSALPVGNPSDASLLWDGFVWMGFWGEVSEKCVTWYDLFSFRAGFYGDYVFNRHLAVDRIEETPHVEQTSLYTNAALLTLNFWDHFDLFAALGATHLFLETNASAFDNPFSGTRLQIESDSHFSWSLGARGSIWECGFTTLGAEVRYFQTRPDIRRATLASIDTLSPSSAHLKYREWQVSVGASHRIQSLVPYIAFKWSRAKLNVPNTTFFFDNPAIASTAQLFNLENLNDFGFVFGMSLLEAERSSLTVEGRFGDETAVHVNGQLRF